MEQTPNGPILSFIPNGDGTSRVEQEPAALPPAQLARAMTAARLVLHGMDTNADGRIDQNDAIDAITQRATNEYTRDVQRLLELSNRQRFPWMREDSVVLDNQPLFDRNSLVEVLHMNPALRGLRRHELDQAITEALPGGVATITLADECRDHPELPCLPLRDRVLVHRDGPTI